MPERLIIVVETPAWDILKNVQKDGYTPENRRNLRKSREFQEIESTPGNIFRYEDDTGVFLVKEYPEREKIEVEMEDDGSPNLVPMDYGKTAPQNREGPRGGVSGSGTHVALYYEGEEEAVREVQRLLEEDDRYRFSEGKKVRKYRRGDTAVYVQRGEGAVSVDASGEPSSDGVEVPEEIREQLDLLEMAITEAGDDDGESRLIASEDSIVSLEDMR